MVNVKVNGSGRLVSSSKITSLNAGEVFVFGSNAAGWDEDPLWDPWGVAATEARLELLFAEADAGNPLADEIWRMRERVLVRACQFNLLAVAETVDDLRLRLLFDKNRNVEVVEKIEEMGGIQMGTVAWVEQLGWIAESRVAYVRGDQDWAMDRLLLALEHSPGPWGQADPDYLLRGLCDLAFIEAPWLGRHGLQREAAELALFVAGLAGPWRGAWYDELLEGRLLSLSQQVR